VSAAEFLLESEFRSRAMEVPLSAQKQLALYAAEVEHWNRAVNLTALHGAALIRRLIVEPVWVGQLLDMNGIVADVGSGNGSPGIPLSVTRRFSATHLIEPRLKRAAFLRHVVAKLGLKTVTVNRGRIEEIPVSSVISDWIALQAIDPGPFLQGVLQNIGKGTTRVVWITSVDQPPVPSAEKLQIPGSSTIVWVFRLDQI
jgi:16S rRNA (guanine(527)-N(7))-methyltransferase RsmG